MSIKNKLTIGDLLDIIKDKIRLLTDHLDTIIKTGFIDSQTNFKEWSKENVDIIKTYYSDIKKKEPEDKIEQKLEILKQNIIDNLSINILKYYFNCSHFKKILELTGKSDINIRKDKDLNFFLEAEEFYEPEFVEEEIGELSEEEESELNEMFGTEKEEILNGIVKTKMAVESEPETKEIEIETFEPFIDTEENQELYRKDTGGNPIRNRKPTKRYLKWLEDKK